MNSLQLKSFKGKMSEEAPTNIYSHIKCAPPPQSYPIQAFVLGIKIKLQIIGLQGNDVKAHVIEVFKESKESSKRIRKKPKMFSSGYMGKRRVAVLL